MMELKTGCHYFLAIQRGSDYGNDLATLQATWEKAGIYVHILRLYDKPSQCMAFTEKQESVA